MFRMISIVCYIFVATTPHSQYVSWLEVLCSRAPRAANLTSFRSNRPNRESSLLSLPCQPTTMDDLVLVLVEQEARLENLGYQKYIEFLTLSLSQSLLSSRA